MEIQSVVMLSKLFGASIATLVLGAVGIALGRIFSAFIEGAFRNPEVTNKVFPMLLLLAALTEALGLFAFLIALLMLFAF